MGDRRRFWWIMVREMRDEGQQRWESGPAREVCMWGAGARPGQGPQEHSRGQKQGPAKSERTQVDVRVLLGSTVTFYPGMQRPADTGQQCVGCSLGPASPPPPSGSWFSRIAANCFDWLAQECTKVSQWPGHQNKNLICATWNPATCKSHNIRAWRPGEWGRLDDKCCCSLFWKTTKDRAGCGEAGDGLCSGWLITQPHHPATAHNIREIQTFWEMMVCQNSKYSNINSFSRVGAKNRWQYFAILRMCSCVFCNCRDWAGMIRWRVPIISRPGPRSQSRAGCWAADSWATPGNFATCKKVAKYCRPTT